MLVSIDITAAQPPSFSRSDILNSLNHTSPQTGTLFLPECLSPTIRTLTFPKFGFPLIATRLLAIPPAGNSGDDVSLSCPSIIS